VAGTGWRLPSLLAALRCGTQLLDPAVDGVVWISGDGSEPPHDPLDGVVLDEQSAVALAPLLTPGLDLAAVRLRDGRRAYRLVPAVAAPALPVRPLPVWAMRRMLAAERPALDVAPGPVPRVVHVHGTARSGQALAELALHEHARGTAVLLLDSCPTGPVDALGSLERFHARAGARAATTPRTRLSWLEHAATATCPDEGRGYERARSIDRLVRWLAAVLEEMPVLVVVPRADELDPAGRILLERAWQGPGSLHLALGSATPELTWLQGDRWCRHGAPQRHRC